MAIRPNDESGHHVPAGWTADEIAVLEAVAGVVALLLENTRLLERDREPGIHFDGSIMSPPSRALWG